MNFKKWFSGFMALSICASLAAPAFAAEPETQQKDPFPYHYSSSENAFELAKISHPDTPANTRTMTEKHADGVVDYLVGGRLGVPGAAEGANGQGDRGQSYSWAAISYGDWMYVSTLFSAMMSTMQLAPSTGDGREMDQETLDKLAGVLYRGDFFTQEEDGKNPGCALVKVNVKTGELKIVMDRSMTEDSYGNTYNGFYKNGINPQFRNAVTLNGKLYFCGAPNGIPSVWEINPETDQFRRVYADPVLVKNPMLIRTAISEDGLCVAIRGMTVMDGHLMISCVGPDINPYILISKTSDPADGFNKIASTWDEDSWAKTMQPHGWPAVDENGSVTTKKGELFGYPASHIKDAIYGGSIFEMIPYNGDLYVSICTGTQGGGTYGGNSTPQALQSFALVRGSYEGDITDRGAWTWEAVVGDKADGAKYGFGIDPARTRASAATLMVYQDYLYIGEYNDAEIAMLNMMFDMDMGYLADNLKQAVNLYRMDKEQNIELVAGSPTKLFPESLSGLKSGFGEKHTVYENQYIWRMEVFQNKLYVGTFDQGSLLYPIAQFSNGDILHMSADEWKVQLKYLKDLIKLILDRVTNPHEALVAPDGMPQLGEVSADGCEAQLRELLGAQEELETYLNGSGMNVFSLPAVMSENTQMDSLLELHQAMTMLSVLLDQEDSWTLEQEIAAKEIFLDLYRRMLDCYENLNDIPPFLKEFYGQILNRENLEKLANAVRCLCYLRTAEQGFDMFVTEDGEHFSCITRDGLGDPYNQGSRVFASNHSEENPWMCVGTANPFYGTQLWRLEGEGLNLPAQPDPDPSETPDPDPDPSETPDPDPDPSETPDPDPEPSTTPDVKPPRPSSGGHVSTTYSITIADTQNGEVKSNYKRAYRGDTVTLTVKADEDYELSNLVVTDRRGEAIELEQEGEQFFFKMPASAVRVTGTFKHIATSFIDVPTDAYYKDPVKWAQENGVTGGMGDDMFGPDLTCTRAQAVTFLWRASGSPEPAATVSMFEDIDPADYFYKAVLWGTEKGITLGTTPTAFSPNENCLRSQIVTFLWRTLEKPAAPVGNPFLDVPADAYYKDAVLWAVGDGVTVGTEEGLFSPDDFCTRAQIVTFLHRALGK